MIAEQTGKVPPPPHLVLTEPLGVVLVGSPGEYIAYADLFDADGDRWRILIDAATPIHDALAAERG